MIAGKRSPAPCVGGKPGRLRKDGQSVVDLGKAIRRFGRRISAIGIDRQKRGLHKPLSVNHFRQRLQRQALRRGFWSERGGTMRGEPGYTLRGLN